MTTITNRKEASREAARLAVYRKEFLPDNILAELQLYEELFDKGYQYAQQEIKERQRLTEPDSQTLEQGP